MVVAKIVPFTCNSGLDNEGLVSVLIPTLLKLNSCLLLSTIRALLASARPICGTLNLVESRISSCSNVESLPVSLKSNKLSMVGCEFGSLCLA